MALRINTNVASMNAQRQLGIQNAGLNKSLERLSSGLRINRAADDAAGLAISETLRAQITGMGQATANSQDAINLIQTAEGGLNETTNILQRMRELAVQAANDTYTQGDRSKIQEEVDQLKQELTRIAGTTQFNGRTLLDGTIGQAKSQVDGYASIQANQRVGALNGSGQPQFGDLLAGVSLTNSGTASVDVAMEIKVVATATTGVFNIEVRGSDGTSQVLTNVTNNAAGPAPSNGDLFTGGVQTNIILASGGVARLDWGSIDPSTADIGDVATVQVQSRAAAVTTDNALTFQIGQNEGQIIKFGVSDFTSKAMNLEAISVFGANDQASRTMAQDMIGVVDEALRRVNVERARMGAVQNRLEHSIANLNVAKENLSSSESRIRDTDVAFESAQLTRGQILVQAGTAMLAQANSMPQNALSLLKG
jgi:flagellin